MQIESVNVGREETIIHGNTTMSSGICKYPIDAVACLLERGIDGDAIVDLEHHGGRDQAIYAYSADDYDWWRQEMDRDFTAGLFGENLTIRGMPSDMNIGDRLLIGDVVLEATSPRIPCSTLATRMQDSSFGMAFRKAERPGIYFRVLNSGKVTAGDAVMFVASDESDVSVVELFRFNYALRHDEQTLLRYLEAPLAVRFREKVERKLAALNG